MNEPLTATDKNGVVYQIKALNPDDVLDLYEAAGDASGNPSWMRYAMVVCSVAQIGDLPIPRPARKDQIRALAKRIGNDGMVALMGVLFPISEDEPSPPTNDSAPA